MLYNLCFLLFSHHLHNWLCLCSLFDHVVATYSSSSSMFDPSKTSCLLPTWLPQVSNPKCHILLSLFFLYLSCIFTSSILAQTLAIILLLCVQPPSKFHPNHS